MHNDRLTYAELMHTMFGEKFDCFLPPDTMKHSYSRQPKIIMKVDVDQ